MTGSSSPTSLTAFCARYGSALKPSSPECASASSNAARGISARAETSFASSAGFTRSGSMPVATNAFASTFAVSFGSAPAATTADQSRSSPPVTSTSAS